MVRKKKKKSFFDKLSDWIKTHTTNVALISMVAGFFILGIFFIWISTFEVPDFESFDIRKIEQSRKIYDREGEVILFDINQDIKRTVIPLEDMGITIQHATVAIEDDAFYEHNGFRLKALLRAVKANLSSGEFSQGGSTLTQQIVKNTLLTTDKRISRKIKEIILALKVEKIMTKDQILEVYLNEAPYGGNIYGISEASLSFFGKDPVDLTIAEAAYLAALPQAPTYFSPYGANIEKLNERQGKVLREMRDHGYITEEQYMEAVEEEVLFLEQNRFGIKAPHFVFYVQDYLIEKYGEEQALTGGLKVTTTIDIDLQQKAEEVVKKHAFQNEEIYNASNASLVSINPQTGEILSMVGSRDYFDTEIDGKFNVALAKRQPGSAFKPFIYATAFDEGYTPETVLFDVSTEFQSTCEPNGIAKPGYEQQDCYRPQNYDGEFKGPVTMREALAQSRNVPAVKSLYLTGIADSIRNAKDFGIKTLSNPDKYGLTLVMGGGEVKLIDMVSAYGVFATEGIKQETVSILKIEDFEGNILEEFTPTSGKRVFDAEPLRTLNSVLDDDSARVGLFGSVNNFMYFGQRNVAGKTGTTNNNKDAWMLGYTPNLVTGVWSGNNDNTPMSAGSSISGQLWREYMDFALSKTPNQSFSTPQSTPDNIKPVLRGLWQGGESILIDSISGLLATDLTPPETLEEKFVTEVHSILHWVNKNDPRGPIPSNPSGTQYEHWEYSVQNWWNINSDDYPAIEESDIPDEYDDVHTEENIPEIEIDLEEDFVNENDIVTIEIDSDTEYDLLKYDIFINGNFIGSTDDDEFNFVPAQVSGIEEDNEIKVIVYDEVYNQNYDTTDLEVNL